MFSQPHHGWHYNTPITHTLFLHFAPNPNVWVGQEEGEWVWGGISSSGTLPTATDPKCLLCHEMAQHNTPMHNKSTDLVK